MTTPQLPEGAKPIVASRMRGYKPAAMTIVSMTGPVASDNPLVMAKDGVQYDWRWVRGLDVCLYIADDAAWDATLKEIALQRPAHLSLWNPAGQWGAIVYLVPTANDIGKPVRSWRYELDFLPWMDFQNDDFTIGRAYGRTKQGMPYATHP